jgi:thiol:disulfide interchange protein DsbD
MLAFSSVFALPFFGLALMPNWLRRLPRSGSWLNSVKVVMGLLEIAAAMKFISNVDLVWHWGIFTREVVLASWIALGVMIAAYLLRTGPGLARGFSLASVALSLYLCAGLFGRRLGELESFLPPALTTSASHELSWVVNDYEGALARARQERKLVFIDFTGYTCTNCRWMEANMFPRPEVKDRLQRYVRVRLFTDGEGPVYQKQQELEKTQFKTVALPLYAIVDGQGTARATFPGLTRNSQEFVAFLDAHAAY